MNQLANVLFVIQLMACFTILTLKALNVMSKGELYSFKYVFLGFAGYLLAWLIGFISFAADPETKIFIALFQLESWLMGLMVAFFIFEIFFLIKTTASSIVEPRYSREDKV